jgi:CRISPR system Cascade subunit CasD
MPKSILLLRLEGPLQSWGTRSRWDVRDTGDEPTKSGVIGLLGCALGYGRGDERLLQLDKAVRFGVRVENPGRKVTDYQTVTDFLPTAMGSYKLSGSKTISSLEKARESGEPATIISPRDYLEDAAFLVGLEARNGNESLLESAAHAVQNPRWPLYLGRKCCVPSRPLFEFFGTQFSDLESALRFYEWEWMGALGDGGKARSLPKRRLTAWIETDDSQAPRAVRRQDVVAANAARVYGFRFAILLSNVAPQNLEVAP